MMEGFPGANTPETKEDRISREDFEKIFSEIESLREKDKSLALEYIKGDMDKESVEYYLDKKWLE
ncbi:hypothetical protein KC842_00290 [Candidatus Nomurabacteria bacterium]|nr:hypothetical protein [Candidatus Nomurabacteria bacterium]